MKVFPFFVLKIELKLKFSNLNHNLKMKKW